MAKTQDGKQIFNLVVIDDIPESDMLVIWSHALSEGEECITTRLDSLVRNANHFTDKCGFFVMVHGGQKTFEAIHIHNNIRDTQWMPHSGC